MWPLALTCAFGHTNQNFITLPKAARKDKNTKRTYQHRAKNKATLPFCLFICSKPSRVLYSGLAAGPYFFPSFKVNFFLSDPDAPSLPGGAVEVGDGAALEEVLLLIFESLPFVVVSCLTEPAAGSTGPNDLKPPKLRDCDCVGDAE